ncbi:MAG: gluconokinase [Acidobacteriota bacterium]|nr:gluconokinase [Acidobacteriota bacterium]
MSNVLDEVVEAYEPMPELLSVMAESKVPVLLALDIGTSGVRAALFDADGGELPDASVRLNYKDDTFAEIGTIDADVLLEQLVHAIDSLFANYKCTTAIELIAISCFWHSLLGVDGAARPTTSVLGWSDPRAAEVAEALRAKFDEPKFHNITGCRFHASYWPAKLLRLRNKEPQVFKATSRWLSFAEYLALRLFSETAVSVSMASGTGLLNQRTCEWETELLSALDIDGSGLPEIAFPGQTFHKLDDEYARRWPQLSEARWFPAIGDGAANNIGAGCTSPASTALMIGTSGAMRVLYSGEPPDRIPPELWCYRADRSRVIIGGALSDGGNLYNWIRTSMLDSYDSPFIETELENLQPDAHGLTVLPFWSGERSTGWSPRARGALLGATLHTRPIEILRAAMEAIAYRLALIAQALEPFAPRAEVMVSGHALRSSPAWVQIITDVLGRGLLVTEVAEASTRGAALLALEAAGKITNIEQFLSPVGRFCEPDMSRHERYQVGLERQQQMYEQIRKAGW